MVVPEPPWWKRTELIGLPAASSKTVMPPIAMRKTARAIPASTIDRRLLSILRIVPAESWPFPAESWPVHAISAESQAPPASSAESPPVHAIPAESQAAQSPDRSAEQRRA